MSLKKFALGLMLAVVLAACGPMKYALQGTTLATGADAEMVADTNKDTAVTKLTFIGKNLPPPARIKEGCTAFVAWQRKGVEVQWTRVGVLEYNEGSREGKLADTTIPESAFDFQVTAEAVNDPVAPAPEVIFSQRHAAK
jgi:hypothetical protein